MFDAFMFFLAKQLPVILHKKIRFQSGCMCEEWYPLKEAYLTHYTEVSESIRQI